MGTIEPGDLALIAAILLVIGAGVAIFFAQLARRREQLKHKRVSTGRRQKNTSYDLFEKQDAPDLERTRSRHRRRRAPSPSIDILREEPPKDD